MFIVYCHRGEGDQHIAGAAVTSRHVFCSHDTKPTCLLQAIVEKVTSAAHALQSRADSVPGLEERIAQLEAEAAAADETLAGARAEAATALEKAEADSATAGGAADARQSEALQQVERLTARVAELETGPAPSAAAADTSTPAAAADEAAGGGRPAAAQPSGAADAAAAGGAEGPGELQSQLQTAQAALASESAALATARQRVGELDSQVRAGIAGL